MWSRRDAYVVIGGRPLGLLATLVAIATVAVGAWAFVANYGLEAAEPGVSAPTFASLAVVAAVVVGLAALGIGSGDRLRSRYW